MATKQHERTIARRCALQALYQSEIMGCAVGDILDGTVSVPVELDLDDYARKLVEGVGANAAAIDAAIKDASENWALDRMPVVDRSLLRLAVFEMLHMDDVPVSVSINEAVELAKEFGGEDESHRFVNGILGRIAKGIEE